MTHALQALAGRRVVVTRSQTQAGELVDNLRAMGAQPILLPLIAIEPVADTSELDRAIRSLRAYDWVIFTSTNTVSAFWLRLPAAGRGAADLAGMAVAAVGPATAMALIERGVYPWLMPPVYMNEAIAAHIGPIAGRCILLPQSALARDSLALELRRLGASVDAIAAYRTVQAEPDAPAWGELGRGVDAILFTSSSTVRNFVQLASANAGAGARAGQAVIACIGEKTAHTARELGLTVHVTASEHTVNGLIRSLADYFAANPSVLENLC